MRGNFIALYNGIKKSKLFYLKIKLSSKAILMGLLNESLPGVFKE